VVEVAEKEVFLQEQEVVEVEVVEVQIIQTILHPVFKELS
jgi:hypothetical protein